MTRTETRSDARTETRVARSMMATGSAMRRMRRAEDERRARGALGSGGLLLLAGLAMVGVGPSDGGMVVTLIALLVTIYGIHTFGRLGPEEGGGAL